MFLSFLHPFSIRNTEAPYLWVFYKQIMHFSSDEICFMGSENYFLSPAYYQAQERWEFRDECQKSNVYSIPTEQKIGLYQKYIFAKDLFASLTDTYQNCSNLIWQHLLTKDYPPLSEAIEAIIREVKAKGIDIDAILAWCNTPSLDKIAKKYNIPVIYNEVGPLRFPFYLSTAYWDRSGVNGNTSAHKRYLRFCEEFKNSSQPPEILSLQQLQELFMLRRDGTECETTYSVGVPLQVENDSNMLAYANGFNNLNLCDTVNGQYAKEDVLIRKHPGGYFLLADNTFGITDKSPSSLSFIYKCQTIHTINSSVGLETLLQGRKAVAYGDCPYRFITNLENADERLLALNFFVFCYLIPYAMMYDAEYYKWLLQEQEEIKIFEQNKAIYKILKEKEDFRQEVTDLTNQNKDLTSQNTDLTNQNKDLNLQIVNLTSQQGKLENHISQLISETQNLKEQISAITNTKGYRALEKMRNIYIMNKKQIVDKILPYGSRRRRLIKKILLKTFSTLRINSKMLQNSGQLTFTNELNPWDFVIDKKIVILTTKHCLFIAELIADCCKKVNIAYEIIFEQPENGFSQQQHIVICPQMFPILPARYVAFQMEQSVSSRWFTEDYFARLKQAEAIFDYSLTNIKFLEEHGIELRKVFYLPIDFRHDCNQQYRQIPKEYDIVFYGDNECPRRKRILERLGSKFKLKTINNLFGDELYQELAKAKVIVNIHYYEGALLETTRLYECISLGTSAIVSEKSVDFADHDALKPFVDFVDIDDVDAFEEAVSKYIANPSLLDEKLQSMAAKQKEKEHTAFEYYFLRFLLATDNIHFDDFYANAAGYIHFDNDFWCLGLPEYIDRKNSFMSSNKYGIAYFPGLRHFFGWVGCGMSYKFMLRKAKEMGLESVTICEDDVLFNEDFSEKLTVIQKYLREQSEWDLFSGLIADVNPATVVSKVDDYEGLRFVTLDKMTSTVLNIYNKKFLEKLETWDSDNRDAETNTIDRFIENLGNTVIVTTNPFLVLCKDELTSTLWGFTNDTYSNMICQSNKKMLDKINAFQNQQ